jgi:hypothetical protein
MAYLFSHIDVSSTERGFINVAGQEVVFDAANQYIQRVNSDMLGSIGAFVQGMTENHSERYKLPGAGQLQERDENGTYRSIRANGSWDVAYPLKDWGASIQATDVAMGYMTGEEMSNHIQTVANQNANTVRHRILRRLFKNTTDSFTDDVNGTLTVQPLANGDTVTYPPVIGGTADATEDHYAESGYISSAISNTNDPYVTIGNELEEHFGTPTGGSNIAVFINNAETSITRDLASFTPVADMGISYGDDTSLASVPSALSSMSSARVLGRHDEAGVWIVEWRYIPATYMVGVHLDVDAPLKMRTDPSYTGLGSGLQMVQEDFVFPFNKMTWRHRFGIGTANRLNGYVLEVANGGGYSIPSAFA